MFLKALQNDIEKNVSFFYVLYMTVQLLFFLAESESVAKSGNSTASAYERSTEVDLAEILGRKTGLRL